MNAKKLSAFTSIALGCVMLASCSSSTKASFSPNWCYDTTQEDITGTETLKYEVSFQKGLDLDGYTVEFAKTAKGTYTTSLSPTYNGTETIFVYKTELSIPVTYTCGSNVAEFTDVVTSEVQFCSTKKGMKPIYSKKTVYSHTPNAKATSLDTAYTLFDYDVEITYNGENGSSKLTDRNGNTITNGSSERTVSFSAVGDNDVVYLDNEQLYFALRCLDTKNTSLAVYSDAHKAVKTVDVSYGADESAKFDFTKNGAPYSATIAYTPVSLTYNGKNSGATQNFHIAQKTSDTKNEHRSVILKFQTSAAYGIGHFIYTLTEANFAN